MFGFRSIRRTNLIVLSTCLLSGACRPMTPEREIQDFMSRMSQLVGKEDTEGLVELLDDAYRDFENRDKNGARALIGDYFRRYRGIVTHVLTNRIDSIEGEEAVVRTDIAISSGAARFFRKIVRFSSDNFRFKFGLVRRDERWTIRYAEWKQISEEELFPESQSLLGRILRGK